MSKTLTATFPEYTGNRQWEVTHPAHKSKVKVYAPSEEAAIVAAAKAWGENWTKCDFYMNCTVLAIKEKGAK